MIVVCGHLRELKPHAHTPHVVIIVLIVINVMLTLYYSIMLCYINYFFNHISKLTIQISQHHMQFGYHKGDITEFSMCLLIVLSCLQW